MFFNLSPASYQIFQLLPWTYHREGLILERGLLFSKLTFYCQNQEKNTIFHHPLNHFLYIKDYPQKEGLR